MPQETPKLSLLGKLFESGKASRSPVSLGPPLIVYILVAAGLFELGSDMILSEKYKYTKDCLLVGAITLGALSLFLFYGQIKAAYADEKAALKAKTESYENREKEREKKLARLNSLNVLELPETATNQEIEKQTKKLIRTYHPDIAENKEFGAKKTQEVIEARNYLLNIKEEPMSFEEQEKLKKRIYEWERNAGKIGKIYAFSAKTPIYASLRIRLKKKKS